MGRFRQPLLDRVELFCDRVLDVVGTLEKQGRSRRILDQLTGSGTAVGANAFEADEALSKKDFCKTLGIMIKELNETRFWIRLIGRRGWIKPARLTPLEAETVELKRIFGAMLTRTRKSGTV